MAFTSQDEDRLFGRILVELGLAQAADVEQGLAEQARLRAGGGDVRLGQILVNRGRISAGAVRQALSRQEKTLLACTACGKILDVIGYKPDGARPCPACGGTLCIPGVAALPLVDACVADTVRAQPRPAGAAGAATAETLLAGGAGAPTRPAPAAAAPTDAAPETAGVPFGRYRLLDRLGAGGMGIVWKAWDTQLRRIVALKQVKSEGDLDAETRERFLREARLAAKLRHPQIIAIHDVGEIDGRPYLTMDYVEGRTFDAYLAAHQAARRAGDRTAFADLRTDVALLAEVAGAVAYAHGQGIVHRDLKPGNVLLSPELTPFVMDFGLAQEVECGEAGAVPGTPSPGPRPPGRRLTVSGQAMGTPGYMSPEQVKGDLARLGPPTDVWALGVILYEVLTGRLPFERESTMATMIAAVQEDAPPPRRQNPQLSPELEAICLKALERDLARRYLSAGEFAEELRRWLRGEPVIARAPGPLLRLGRWARRRRAPVAAATVVVLVLAGAATWGWRRHLSETRRGALMLSEIAETVTGLEEGLMRRISAEESADVRRMLAEPSLRMLDRLVADLPDFGPAWAWRGKVRELLGQTAEAERDFDEGIRRSPETKVVWFLRALHRIGRYAHTRGLPRPIYEETEIEFEEAHEETHEEAEWLAGGLSDLARMQAAAEADRSLGERDLALGRAVAALYSGGRAGWTHTLEEVGETSGPRAWKLRGLALYHLERFEEAGAMFGRVLGEWPQDAESLAYRGLALLAAGLTMQMAGQDGRVACDRAVEDLGRAIGKAPQDARAHAVRATVYVSLGQAEGARGEDPRPSFRKALADCDDALRLAPEDAGLHEDRGCTLMELAKAEEERGGDPRALLKQAAAALAEAIRREPEEAEAHEHHGMALWRLAAAERARGGDPRPLLAASLDAYGECLKHAPEDAEALEHRGNAFRSLAETEEAPRTAAGGDAGHLTGAGAGDPRPTYEKALADYDTSIRLNPEDAETWENRGLAHWGMGAAERLRGGTAEGYLKEAEEDFRSAVGRKNPKAWLPLGRLLRECGRREEALAAFAALERALPGRAAEARREIEAMRGGR